MPETTKDLKISRLKLRRDQLIELHLAPLPEPPEAMLKLPGVGTWFNSLRLARERDQQALHRMVQQMGTAVTAAAEPATVSCTTLPGSQGIQGPQGLQGPQGPAGADGAGGSGDSVLTWMNL
jgi:hypothetical protein